MLTLNFSPTTTTGLSEEKNRAINLFQQSYYEGAFKRLLRQLGGRSVSLRCLGAAVRHGGRHLGQRTVPIAEIIGSESRTRDFDRAFAPLSERTRDRWISIAQARFRGRALPAVLLVRAEDGYYVRDGHHRISVARAMGEEFVEADVVTWE